MMMKKRLDGGLKKILIFFLFFIFSSKSSYCSQILDYETEVFVNKIIQDIIKVNKINREIQFKINNSDEINAFVDINNVIHINSGLIIYCSDYVALVSVLAHEIGHIDRNHITLRKKTIESSKKLNNLGVLSVIAGSTLSQNPQLLQGSILTSAALSNQYIVFSKDQEMEADLYALKTLNLLNTNSKSIQTLLETIEDKLLDKGFSKDKQRISTHPYFEDRIALIKNFQNNNGNNFNEKYNESFNYIKAKFIGYSDNEEVIKELNEPFKTYAESIKISRKGNLKMSLQNLNEIIKKNKNNYFLLETKADILFSHGYTDSAVKFYKKNLDVHPFNYYAQIRIFENIKIENLSISDTELIFQNNKELLYKYFNNKNILLKYIELAQKLNKKEWLKFFNFVLSINDIDKEVFKIEINNFKKTKNKDLLKLINVIQKLG
ncbi:M48 family metalloprotease [Pelagibacteraceae bacterium]|nr:M48 family metalloprotease [Pelagibacteraceae bacterium]